MNSDKPKVKINFNGKEVIDEVGKPLLQAAIDAGIEVPHFCYHPGIGIEGSCRLCLVHIEGIPKLQTSCTVPLKEGMVVSSVSEPVKRARKGVLEFFLLNHPLDCPICDKGGECPLQNYSLDSGQGTSRFDFKKMNKEKHQVIGEHIILDKERCVLCNRCVRFSRNFAGKEELQIRGRGTESEIFVPEGTQLTSGFTGNLADICPVGSLTTREFRFKARPWEMKTTDSVCGECSLNCSAQMWRKDSTVLRMTPRIEPEVNEWWLCDKGRFSLKTHLTQDRLTQATHVGNGLDTLSPEKVAATVASEIKKVPPGAMAFVADASLTNEEFHQLKTLARNTGNGKVYAPVLKEVYSIRNQLQTLGLSDSFAKNIEAAKTVYVLGENLEKEHPVLVLRVRRLYHTQQLKIRTAGEKDIGFKDVRDSHEDISLHSEKIISFFQQNKISATEKTHVLLSDQWISSKTAPTILKWIDHAKASGMITVSILLKGANVAGFLDQWGDSVRSQSELETDIQRGKIQGIVWFGKAVSNQIFDEYARGMRIFAHVVLRTSDAHSKAHWILPLDTFFEKKGTYTNTFGKVQTLRRSTRVVLKGFEPLSMITLIVSQLGVNVSLQMEQVYEELAKDLTNYPKRISDVVESKKTYDHYERALWR